MRNHGTAVLGLAGAEANGKGMVGIAYNATLWEIQAGSNNEMNEAYWVAAINFVRNTPTSGRRVIILQVQTMGSSNIEAIPSIRTEISAAISDGIAYAHPLGMVRRRRAPVLTTRAISFRKPVLFLSVRRNFSRTRMNGRRVMETSG